LTAKVIDNERTAIRLHLKRCFIKLS